MCKNREERKRTRKKSEIIKRKRRKKLEEGEVKVTESTPATHRDTYKRK